MASKALGPELVQVMKELRLGQILPTLADRIALAEKDDLPIQDFLLAIFADEVERRRDTSTARRAHDAGLADDMVFERWDKTAKVTYDRRVLQELVSLRFVEAQRNVIVLGPVGVGKTFIANALGHVACRSGFNVKMLRGDDLLRLLRESRLDNSREVVLTELSTIDLLIIDDFALEPMTRDESRDIYQLFIERTGKTATIITSNRDTDEWLAVFDEPIRGQGAVDRFKNNAYDLVVDGESYRPRLKPSIDKDGPPPSAPVTKPKPLLRRRKRARA